MLLQVYEWVKQIAYSNSIPVKVSSGFMSLMCDLHVRFKSGLTFLEHASNSFSDVYGAIRDDVSIVHIVVHILSVLSNNWPSCLPNLTS